MPTLINLEGKLRLRNRLIVFRNVFAIGGTLPVAMTVRWVI